MLYMKLFSYYLFTFINMMIVEGFEVICEVCSVMEIFQIVNYAQSLIILVLFYRLKHLKRTKNLVFSRVITFFWH